jgi:hypothetical protein
VTREQGQESKSTYEWVDNEVMLAGPLISMSQANQRLVEALAASSTCLALIGGVAVEFTQEANGGGIIVGVGAGLVLASSLLFIPRRYEVYSDGLAIVFLLGRWDIGFDTVTAVQERDWEDSLFFWGLKFVTTFSRCVEIRRDSKNLLFGPRLLVSPARVHEFTEVLSEALGAYRMSPR